MYASSVVQPGAASPGVIFFKRQSYRSTLRQKFVHNSWQHVSCKQEPFTPCAAKSNTRVQYIGVLKATLWLVFILTVATAILQ
jgi:hypothetical protein